MARSHCPLSLALALLLGAGACQREVSPDIVENCTSPLSAADTSLPVVVQYQRLRLGSLCALSPEPGIWRIAVGRGGYSGEEFIYTRLRRIETGGEIAWRRFEYGKPVDSGVVSLSSSLDRSVLNAVLRKDFGPQVDSESVCYHCGSIWAEVRRDSTVDWFLGDFKDPTKSGLFRALEALNRESAPTQPKVR